MWSFAQVQTKLFRVKADDDTRKITDCGFVFISANESVPRRPT